MIFFSRIITNIKRRLRARRIGVKFTKRSIFKLPSFLYINGNRIKLHFPEREIYKSMFTEIFLDDDYQMEELRSKRINTIIDIGANIGLFSIAAKLFFPHAAIHSYEPNPEFEIYLRQHASSAGFKYYMEAVGLKDGQALFNPKKNLAILDEGTNAEGYLPMVSFKECIQRMGGGS